MRSLFKRSIALLLFLALILPYCNVLPMASAVTENWEFYGDYKDVAVIKDSNSSPSMQGLAVGSQMMYAIKTQSDNGKSVITMTNKGTGTTTILTDAATGYNYFTGHNHANDMAVWGIDGYSHIFVATTMKGANAIIRYRREGSKLYKVATYHLKSGSSDICATAMDVMDVDSSGNIHLITKWGQDIYTGTVHKDTGNTTVNMTKLCSIGKDLAYIKGKKLDLSEWTNQGFGYHDNNLFVPLSGPQSGANIALHRSVVLVYRLDEVTENLRGCTIYPTDAIAFRVTSDAYSALFEIESVDICSGDGKLYFNTNRRVTDTDTNHDGISYFDGYTYTKPAKPEFDNIKHFNCRYLANGGTGTMEDQRINYGIGTKLSKNLYTRTGYTFAGWTAYRTTQGLWFYTNGTDEGWYAAGSQPSDHSLYIYRDQQSVAKTSSIHEDRIDFTAQWSPITYTVNFDGNGGTGSVSNMTFTVEQTKTLPANGFTKTGYTFKGWQISGQSTILQPGTPAAELAKYVGTDSSITLVANWEANNYTVTWNVDGQKYATTNVAYGQPITAPSYTAPEGYTFSGWTVPATMPAKDLTLDATLTVNKYTITFKDEDGDVLKSGKVAYGDMPTAPADPTKKPDGHYTYSFAGWTPEITKVTGEATYTATYKETENSYYIVGSMNDWTAAEDNKMSRVTDDVYFLTMALPKGTYQYKANIGNWDICWPGDANESINVPYDTQVVFTLNRLTGEITAEYVVKVALAGGFNNWNQNNYMTDNGDGTYTSVLELTAGTYEFKVIDETVWKGNNGTIMDTTTTTSAVGWVMDQNQNNCKLKATGGTYTFTYNTNTDSLVITYEPAKYTITFVDDDGNELSEQTVTAGQMPKIPADPTKAETAEYTYEFTGWTPEIVAATGDATYTAQFKATPKSYTITYMVDGVKVHEDTYAYGANVTAWSYTAAEGYTFSGWDTEIPATMPAENLTITGTTSIKSYTITYMVDGVKVHEDTYAYGANVTAWSYTAAEGYTFSGWDAEIPATMPASDLTINGTLERTIHIVTYYIDNEVDDEEELYYGETYLITGIIPEKEGFTFKGWDKDQDGTPDYQPDEEIIIKSDLKLHAVFDPLYKIYFNYADESGQTVTWSIFYGEMDEVIQLDTMNWWDYANFIGWDVDGDGEADYEGEAAYTIKGDQTMVAVFEPFYVDLDLGAEDAVYVDAEGNDITRIYMENEHRNSVTLTNFPTRTGYTFLGWSVEEPYSGTSESLVCVNEETGKPEVTLVLGSNATATAIWEAIDYKLTFTINGEVYGEPQTFHYGDAIEAPAYEIPEGHTFSGWTVPETMPAEDLILDATLTVNTYTVTWIADGQIVDTEIVEHGKDATKSPAVPEKIGYEGTWKGSAICVTSDVTIRAEYEKLAYRNYIDSNGDGIYDGSYCRSPYGIILQDLFEWHLSNNIVKTPEGYHLSGWKVFLDQESTQEYIGDIRPAQDIYIQPQFEVNTYTISFDTDGDGNIDVSKTVAHGEIPDAPAFSKADTVEWVYILTGWRDSDGNNYTTLPAASGAETYTAVYEAEKQVYTITWVIDGVTETTTVAYGEMPTHAAPTKAATAEYTYKFTGWTPALTAVTGDATYTAKFEQKYRYYTTTIDFNGGIDKNSGKPTSTSSYFYSEYIPLFAYADYASREGYTLVGWNSEADGSGTDYGTNFMSMPAHDVTIYAQWEPNTYTITLLVDGEQYGEVLNVKYGEKVTLPTPEKAADGCIVYIFTGWNETVPTTMPASNLTFTGSFTADVQHTGNNSYTPNDDGTTHTVTCECGEVLNASEAHTYDETTHQCACEKVEEFTITFFVRKYSSEELGRITAPYGSDITEQVAALVEAYNKLDPGKYHYGWFDNETDEKVEFTTMPGQNMTVNAVCAFKFFDITWYVDDSVYHTAQGCYTNSYLYDAPTNDPTKTGYTFTGWKYYSSYDAETGIFSDEFTSFVMPNHELYANAQWEAIDYTLTFTINGEVYGEPQTFHYGDTIEAPAYEIPEGHTFSGWTVPETMPAEDLTLDATLTVNTYTVYYYTTDSFDNGTVPVYTAQAAYGAAFPTYELTVPEGHYFGRWATPDDMTYEFPETMPAQNLHLIGYTYPNSYTLTIAVGANVGEHGVGFKYIDFEVPYGKLIKDYLPETPDVLANNSKYQGTYTFDYWHMNTSMTGVDVDTVTMPAKDVNIYAEYRYTGWEVRQNGKWFMNDDVLICGWFCVNDNHELVTDGSGNWYYGGDDFYVVTGVNRVPYPTEAINGVTYGPDEGDPDQSNSMFIFDESGVFQSEYTGLCELDGKTAYAVNGELPWYAGLVEVDGEYYYFGEDRTMVKGQNLELNKTNDMIFDNGASAVKSGTYTFDENGKLCKYDGIVRIDGKLFEYEDYRLIREIKAKLCFASLSLNGNIAINYYMLLSDEVLNDETAYMQFTMVDGEVIRIPVSQGVETLYKGETYYRFSCMVNAKEMTDNIVSQFFYEGGSTVENIYNVQTYAKYILSKSENEDMKELAKAMLNYGAASQLHFGYNTDNLANAGLEVPDYSNVTIDGFKPVVGQGTELAKLYSASLILKSETTLRFFFQVDSSVENFTVTFNGEALTIKQRGGLYYADVVGIAAKDLDEDVTVTINDGTNTAEVSFNPMAYCQGVQNDTTGAFGQDMKDVVAALYLYNQAANEYFKEN